MKIFASFDGLLRSSSIFRVMYHNYFGRIRIRLPRSQRASNLLKLYPVLREACVQDKIIEHAPLRVATYFIFAPRAIPGIGASCQRHWTVLASYSRVTVSSPESKRLHSPLRVRCATYRTLRELYLLYHLHAVWFLGARFLANARTTFFAGSAVVVWRSRPA